MKLLVYILNSVELLDELLTQFAHVGIGGATILNSRGMARQLYGNGEEQQGFLGSLRALVDPERNDNMTIYSVIRDEQVADAVSAIESVVGPLSEPGTGVVFTLPVDFIKGI